MHISSVLKLIFLEHEVQSLSEIHELLKKVCSK